VCRDAAVPEHAAQTAELGIDAYVAGTLYGEGREQSARRDTHMRERERAHGVWVALSTAAEPSGEYQETSGGSGVRSPGGSLVAQSGSAPGEVLTLVLG
jgi:predicted amidohydrolase